MFLWLSLWVGGDGLFSLSSVSLGRVGGGGAPVGIGAVLPDDVVVSADLACSIAGGDHSAVALDADLHIGIVADGLGKGALRLTALLVGDDYKELFSVALTEELIVAEAKATEVVDGVDDDDLGALSLAQTLEELIIALAVKELDASPCLIHPSSDPRRLHRGAEPLLEAVVEDSPELAEVLSQLEAEGGLPRATAPVDELRATQHRQSDARQPSPIEGCRLEASSTDIGIGVCSCHS